MGLFQILYEGRYSPEAIRDGKYLHDNDNEFISNLQHI